MAANEEYVLGILSDLGLVNHDQIKAAKALAAQDAKHTMATLPKARMGLSV